MNKPAQTIALLSTATLVLGLIYSFSIHAETRINLRNGRIAQPRQPHPQPTRGPVTRFPEKKDVRVGRPHQGGSGCPAGTVNVTYSPDNSAVSVLFDQFSVESGRSSGKRSDQKECTVDVVLTVPEGQTLGIFNVDYRGFASVDEQTSASFRAQHTLTDARTGRALDNRSQTSRVFKGPFEDGFILSDTLGDERGNIGRIGDRTKNRHIPRAGLRSSCGGDVKLNLRMLLNTVSRNGQNAIAFIDSADAARQPGDERGGVVFYVDYEPCR